MDSLLLFVGEHIEPGPQVRNYGSAIYRPLTNEGCIGDQHVILGSMVPAHEPSPGVHRIAALLKHRLLGTHYGSADPRHVDYYLDEFTFRFNRCKSLSRGRLFYRLIQHSAVAPPVTYANIRDNRHLPQKMGKAAKLNG